MHAHHNQNDGYKRMMWMMIPCLLLVGVLLLGGDSVSSSGYLWPILIGLFVIAHIWFMRKGHGGQRDDDGETESNLSAASAVGADGALKKQPGAKEEHKHGGCCH